MVDGDGGCADDDGGGGDGGGDGDDNNDGIFSLFKSRVSFACQLPVGRF